MFLEYLSALEFVNPQKIIFSNSSFAKPQEWSLCNNAIISPKSVLELGIDLSKICLLDSESSETLCPDDASTFSHFLFGGILGNTDEFDFDRTKVLRNMGFATRNLGSVQMTTDTALKTTHVIVGRGIPFHQLDFIDRPTIKAGPKESLILNFRFLADETGRPQIAKGIVELMLADDDDEFNLTQLE